MVGYIVSAVQPASGDPLTVECTNCGGDPWFSWVPIGIGFAGLAIAGFALRMARAEHRVFIQTLQARAAFDVSVKTHKAGRMALCGLTAPAGR